MMNSGKILFFNESEGKGIIITYQKKKIDFFIKEWNDFEVMPSLGLEVVFVLNDATAFNILSKSTYDNGGCEILDGQNITERPLQDQTLQEETVLEQESALEETEKLQEELAMSDGEIEPYLDEAPQEVQIHEEEHESRPDSITISINISTAVSNYFETIKEHIKNREIYKKVPGSLDYILIKRFLITTFNNLSDIDLHILTPKIKMLYNDLRALSGVYDDFIIKTKYPKLAYNEVFLSYQAEYMKIKMGAESTIEKLNQMRTDEEILDRQLKVKKEELSKTINSEEFDALTYELKSLGGAYVDTVHLMAELDDRYKYDMELLKKFENEYRADFAEKFITQAVLYKKDLVKILNAQAFLLDSQLWQQAKKSKAIKAHFKESSISGELNTKTYLKYYLDSLDTSKITDKTKKLFTLYDYLLSVQKDYIMVVMSSAINAMEYEAAVKNLKSTYAVKAFMDEKSAIKWAINNSVKILITEDRLQSVNIEKFLQVYKNHVTMSPKIILLGEKPRASSYPITNLLPRGASARVVSESVKSLLNIKKEHQQ